jgi:hypothetical protein
MEKDVDVNNYTTILGSGGFGLVVFDPIGNTVLKLMYDYKDCLVASEEFTRHKLVYNKYLEFITAYPQIPIYVAKPIAYRDSPITWRNRTYPCGYIMGKIDPIKTDLIHIVLKPGYESSINKLIGRIYEDPVSETNPSRGFFGSCEWIEKNVQVSCKDLAYEMGILFGICVFGAELIPIDAEYVLCNRNGKISVALLDFGMFTYISLNGAINDKQLLKKLDSVIHDIKFKIIGIDLYFPDEDDKYYPELMLGFTKAAEFYINKHGIRKPFFEYILKKMLE